LVKLERHSGLDEERVKASFLTTTPNAWVKPIHPKAMQFVPTNREEVDEWTNAPWEEAKTL
jgi:putative SOS response-associated peptidase YedK